MGNGVMGGLHGRVLRRLGARVVTVDPVASADHRCLADAPAVDAAVVATPVDRLAAAVFALAGMPVLVEKPMCETTRDAARIAELATRAPVMVGYVERFNPAVLEVARRASGIRRIVAWREGPERPLGGQSLAHLGTHDMAVARMLAPDATVAVHTGWARTKTRLLRVHADNGAFEVDYLARTLNGRVVRGPDPLVAQDREFLRRAREWDCRPLDAEAAIVADLDRRAVAA